MHTASHAQQTGDHAPRLAQELASMRQHFATELPIDVRRAMDDATATLVASGQARRTLQPGQCIVDFVLPDALGRPAASMALRAGGPLLITFYRGEWCPYCNLALRALQRELPAFTARGVTLVAISPEQPDHALTLQEKHGLAFPVLSDQGNAVARSFGLVFALPPKLRPVYASLGLDLPDRNGDASHELPMPGSFLVDREGIVLAAAVQADYRTRLEPADALDWIDRLLPTAA
jgi:peroxiredoxin